MSRCPSPGSSPTQIVLDPTASNTGVTAARSADRLHDGFFRRARTHPAAPALLGADGRLSYAELAERALAVARRVRTGAIGVNGGMYYGADAPFGGYKSSGWGRQCGIEGFAQYLETKTIGCRKPREA